MCTARVACVMITAIVLAGMCAVKTMTWGGSMQKLAVTAQAYALNTPAHIQSTHDPSVSGAMVLPTSEGETMTTSKMEMAMRAEAPRTGATASTAPHTLKEPTHHHEADTSLGRCHNGLCFITGCSGIVIVNSSQSPVSEGSAFKPSAESLDHATTQCGALKDVLESLPPVPKIVHVSVPQQALQLSPCTVREYGVLEAGIVRLSRLNPEWQVRLTGDDELERYLRNHLNPDDYAEISKQHPVAKTDLWRLIKMYNEGGVYMDVDRLVNVQLDNLLDKGAVRCVLPSFYQEAKQGVYQFSDFSQDVVISAPGNPMYSLAANLNVQRRRQCRQHGGNVWVPDGAPEAIRCIVFDLGPTTYMHAISQCLTGKQVRRGDHGYNAAVQRRVVELSPLLTVVAEQPPFDTVLFNGSVSGTTVMGVPSPGGDRPVEFEAWKNRVEELRQQDKKRFYCDMKITRDWQQHNLDCGGR